MRINLSLFILSTLVGILVLESCVRHLQLAPTLHVIKIDTKHGQFISDSKLLYKPKPKPKGKGNFNWYGIRETQDFEIEKEPGTYRIIVIGDSVAYGAAVARVHTYSTLLEDEFHVRERGEVATVNLGVHGYGAEQIVGYFKLKGLALKPDLVIYAFCLNDFWVQSSEQKSLRAHKEWKTFEETRSLYQENLTRYSHLYRVVAQLTSRSPREESTAQVVDRLERSLGELKELSMRNNFKVLAVIFPFDVNEQPYKWDNYHRQAAKLFNRHNIPFIDLKHRFLAEYEKKGKRLFVDPIHPNRWGYEAASKETIEYLGNNL